MKKIEDLVLSIVALIVSFGAFKLSAPIIVKSISNEFMSAFLGQVIFAAFVLIFVVVLRKTWIFHSDMRKLKSGWTAALIMLFPLVSGLVQAFAMIPEISVTGIEFILFVARMLLIGFCEEALFRGIIQNAFHNLFGEDSTIRVYLGVICGSLCFGAVHLGNATSPEITLSDAAVQAIYTFFFGILFATVYFRTGKNLWLVVIIHAINDFFALIATGMLSGHSGGESIASAASSLAENNSPMQILVTFFIYSAISLFLLRPKKIRQLQEI